MKSLKDILVENSRSQLRYTGGKGKVVLVSADVAFLGSDSLSQYGIDLEDNSRAHGYSMP